MELITGYQLEDHVTSLQDAMWHRGIWKDDCIISVGENLKAEIITNNEIRVRSGILNMQGKFCSIDINTYDSLAINNGTAGENRIDLIVARYEKNSETQVENVSLKVIQDTPSVPSYTEGNIDNGDLIAELPLYKVNIEGINITKVECVIEVQPPLNLARTLLFQGGVSTGNIQLVDNITNYRFLMIGFNTSDVQAINSSVAIFPVLFGSISYQDFSSIREVVPSEKRTIVSYVGTLQYLNETTLSIYRPITNLYHIAEGTHSGVTQYAVKEIWGIR